MADATVFNQSADAVAQESQGRRDVGLVFIGGSVVAGYGDPKGLGWVGRVVARTLHADLDLTAYNLGVRGDTSADVLARWRRECVPRWTGRAERRLVVSVGANDVHTGMSLARSRLNLANVLDDATSTGVASFVVSPAPTSDPVFNAELEGLVQAQADVCARRGVPYVDCYRPLLGHEQWVADLASPGDGVHPGHAGYGLIAWLVLNGGWRRWLRLPG
ncbi:MAG TPA: GDSL-type esterase/lipase family protein [Dermatophilaceae bacterium]|nr:GDSL-type esterase/lipase family protein [Dermatophilaceae bacterium]